MHKLDRAAVAAPVCLSAYMHGTHTWDDIGIIPNHKDEIRQQLEQLQGRRCAYCEGSLDILGQHIEHFRRKNAAHFPELTFDWDNLFWSCDVVDHCGHYKDRPSGDPYDPNRLIKPDQHDPQSYLYFHSSGEVRVRPHLSNADSDRAFETIRVFNLNQPALMALRRRALKMYADRNPDMLETLMSFDELDRRNFIEDEIQATRNDPHWTVICHFFEKAH